MKPEDCEHTSTSKEYYLGSDTGDRICNDCGEVFSPAELERLRAAREAARANKT